MFPQYVPVDALAAAASYVRTDFGAYGYSVATLYAGFGHSVFELRASDGSRRVFAVDRYGNIELGPDDLDSDGDWHAFSRAASDALYIKRNGFAVAAF